MEYPKIRFKIGDALTLTTLQGLTITGEVALVDEAPDGGVRAVAISDDPNRPDPVWVRGDLIQVWRFGAAVRIPMVGQNGQQFPALPPEMLRNLRQQ